MRKVGCWVQASANGIRHYTICGVRWVRACACGSPAKCRHNLTHVELSQKYPAGGTAWWDRGRPTTDAQARSEQPLYKNAGHDSRIVTSLPSVLSFPSSLVV